MNKNSRMISIGLVDEEVQEGTHMCLVFDTEKERIDSLLKYLLSGLSENDRCAAFSEKTTEDDIRTFLDNNHISYDENKEQNRITLSGTNDVYFPENCFEPERMLNLLTNYYIEAKDLGFNGARVIGEMEPLIETLPGGERLLEYECKVSLLAREYPITAICQYDANRFSGGTIMNILKVHPKMIVNGSVVLNPFFIEPEEFLANNL